MGACSRTMLPVGEGVALQSRSADGVRLSSAFDVAVYGCDSRNHLTIILIAGSIEHPQRVLTMRTGWEPVAGKTPVDSQATNTTLHYAVFTSEKDEEGELGIYSGAGFVYLYSEPGESELNIGVWDSAVKLMDRTSGFHDLVGQGVVSGRAAVRRDDVETQRLLQKLGEHFSRRLGYPRLAQAK